MALGLHDYETERADFLRIARRFDSVALVESDAAFYCWLDATCQIHTIVGIASLPELRQLDTEVQALFATPLNAAERAARYKIMQEQQGRVRRNTWATPAEWDAIAALLDEMRAVGHNDRHLQNAKSDVN